MIKLPHLLLTLELSEYISIVDQRTNKVLVQDTLNGILKMDILHLYDAKVVRMYTTPFETLVLEVV